MCGWVGVRVGGGGVSQDVHIVHNGLGCRIS